MHRCSCSTNNIDGVKMNIEYWLIIVGYVVIAVGGYYLGGRISGYFWKRKERKKSIMTWGELK